MHACVRARITRAVIGECVRHQPPASVCGSLRRTQLQPELPAGGRPRLGGPAVRQPRVAFRRRQLAAAVRLPPVSDLLNPLGGAKVDCRQLATIGISPLFLAPHFNKGLHVVGRLPMRCTLVLRCWSVPHLAVSRRFSSKKQHLPLEMSPFGYYYKPQHYHP